MFTNLPILTQSYWRDEAFSILLSLKTIPEIINISSKDASPPLYYIFLHFWVQAFGTGEVQVRLLSFVFYIMSIVVGAVLLSKLTKNTFVGIGLSVCVFLNPFLVEYAFEARAYSLMILFVMLGVTLFLFKKYFLSGFLMGLAILTHNFALFSTIGLGISYIFMNRTLSKEFWKNGGLFSFFPITALLLWGGFLLTQITMVVHEFWIPEVTDSIFKTTLDKFLGGDVYYPRHDLLYVLYLILGLFAMPFLVRKKEEFQQKFVTVLLFVGLFPIFITYLVSRFATSIYFERYLIVSIPMVGMAIALALYNEGRKHTLNNYLYGILAFVFICILYQSDDQLVHMQPKPAINWAVAQITKQAQKGDVIIPKDKVNYLETKWYAQQSNVQIPVYVYSEDGTIPFYIGGALYDKSAIITKYPTNTRIWEVEPDGGYQLLTN